MTSLDLSSQLNYDYNIFMEAVIEFNKNYPIFNIIIQNINGEIYYNGPINNELFVSFILGKPIQKINCNYWNIDLINLLNVKFVINNQSYCTLEQVIKVINFEENIVPIITMVKISDDQNEYKRMPFIIQALEPYYIYLGIGPVISIINCIRPGIYWYPINLIPKKFNALSTYKITIKINFSRQEYIEIANK